MPDITMCANKNCGMRDDCYRYKATPSEYQSYAMFKPDRGGCAEFLPLWDKKEVGDG